MRELSDVILVGRGGRVIGVGGGGVEVLLQAAGTRRGTGPHALMASMNDVLEDI
ncbi:hypothetical protein [Myxococcus sp. AB036A]|uniref:hypothetical protein n=1 Tax=Myxococcus sp. AB036A TaxID=2562793 RepID=UPI00189129A7|nr:hypothetical protein [Myxococcus sp. AB036A]